jgi:hypothetical protein
MSDVLLGPPAVVDTPSSVMVPCIYCREPIAADSFVAWPDGKPLLSAGCPSCHRRVTLPASSWRRSTCHPRPVRP